ncbi:MAG: glycine cleavage system protein H [Dehalococcoidia bacterium]|nr:glycine cleavage system protein H [Dehalococcoidia bacterium]
MADEFLETTVDKFVFRVRRDCWYSQRGVWVRPEDGSARVGVSDDSQQASGDVAFVDVQPAGTVLAAGEELASIETVKAILTVESPVSGTIVQVNEALEQSPEFINQAPYSDGWLAVIELRDWEADRVKLLDAERYLEVMRAQALEEVRRE